MPWLLKNGNPDDPLNTDAGQQMKQKDPKYANTVKEWVKKFANQSHLANCGSVWYKDKPKKKKKKKTFSLAELTKSSTTTITKTTSSSSLITTSSSTPKLIMPKTPDIINLPPPKSTRSPSKSMGHIEYSPTNITPNKNNKNNKNNNNDNNNDDSKTSEHSFQDWWSGSKILPNTPSKCGKPQIRRSQSFCVRPDSSPWMINKRQPMRRNTTDPYQHSNNDDDGDDMMNMKLISLDNDLSGDKHKINLNENVIISTKTTKSKRKKKRNYNNNIDYYDHNKLEIEDIDITSSILHDGDSDLSSMDEDPTYDLNQYQSLTSFDLTSINSKYDNKYKYKYNQQNYSQTPSYNDNIKNNHNNNNNNNNHINDNNNNNNNDYGYYFSSKSCNDLYSKSAGFIPQKLDHFICPEFSPLSPTKPIYQHRERILHLSPAKNQKVNTTLNFLNDDNDNNNNNKNHNDNGNDTDIISEDDDDDVAPTPKDSNSNSKCNKSIKTKDVNMKNTEISLQTTHSTKMSLD